MTIAELMITEFDQECRTTRRFLQRLPEDQLTWKPHARSMSAGQLALHIASAPGAKVPSSYGPSGDELPDFM